MLTWEICESQYKEMIRRRRINKSEFFSYTDSCNWNSIPVIHITHISDEDYTNLIENILQLICNDLHCTKDEAKMIWEDCENKNNPIKAVQMWCSIIKELHMPEKTKEYKLKGESRI